MWRKDEDVIRLAGKVIDELHWNGASSEEVEPFKRMLEMARYSHRLRFGGQHSLPALEDKIAEFNIKEGVR